MGSTYDLLGSYTLSLTLFAWAFVPLAIASIFATAPLRVKAV